jgi:hypothetical protein
MRQEYADGLTGETVFVDEYTPTKIMSSVHAPDIYAEYECLKCRARRRYQLGHAECLLCGNLYLRSLTPPA